MSSKRTSSSSSSTNNNSNKGAPPNLESAPKASDDATFNYFHLPGGTSAFNPALPNYMSPFPALNAQPLLGIPSSSSASNTLPPLPNMPTYYPDASNDSGDDDKPGKKRRTNYRRPENAAKLNAAVNALIMQKQDPNAPKDIRSVSKIFNIPYNTLRDNYLRVTTGDVRSVKRPRKGDGNDGESSEFLDGHLDDFGYDYDDDDNDSDEKPVPKKNSSSNKKEK